MMHTKYTIVTAMMLAAASLVAFAPVAQAKPVTFSKVNFICQMESGQYVTKLQDIQATYDWTNVPAYKEQALGEPTNVIVWKSTLASDHPQGLYEPQSRCQVVSTHLTNLASALGITSSAQLPSRIADISQVGIVNSQKVIFPAYRGQPAADENVIFTLNPTNATKSSDVLTQFQFGISPNVGGELPANLMPPVVE